MTHNELVKIIREEIESALDELSGSGNAGITSGRRGGSGGVSGAAVSAAAPAAAKVAVATSSKGKGAAKSAAKGTALDDDDEAAEDETKPKQFKY